MKDGTCVKTPIRGAIRTKLFDLKNPSYGTELIEECILGNGQ
jgi:hypothetical protein